MLKIGVISDIHSNIQALTTVLDCLDDADIIIACGDTVGYGANPNEVVDTLVEYSILNIIGNHEIALQRNAAQAAHYAFNDRYGRSVEDIEKFPENIMAVSRDDIIRVAREVFDPDRYALAIVRPKD